MTDTVVVTINGVDRTSQLLIDSLSIDNMMAAASTAAFAMDAGAYTPTAWHEVLITVNGTRVFGGYLTGRQVEGIGPGGSKVARWHCECTDYTALFDKVLINSVAYGATEITDRTIVQQLFSTYLPADGFNTTTYVYQCYYGVAIAFDNMTLRQALDKLAEQAKAQWFVDCQKRVYWFARYSPPNASLEIDTVTPDGVTRIDPRPSLQRELDDLTIVNRLRVYGGYVQGSQASNTFTADGTGRQTTFGPLTARPHDVIAVTVAMPGTTLDTFTGERIGYVPEHVLYTDGVTSNQREVLVNRDQKTIQIALGRPSLTPGYPPPAGAVVALVFHQSTTVSATVNDTVSQAAYGRILEQQIYRPELITTQAATDYGSTWLTKYGASQEHISFDVDVFGLQPGTMLAVNAPTLGVTAPDLGLLLENSDDVLAQNSAFFALEVNGIVGRYVIQSVRYAAIPTVGGVLMRATVKAGEYEHTLLDMLKPVMASQQTAPTTVANQLSDISPALGEIVAGRAVLTDGGTAAFGWNAYSQHTGVVVGLDATATPRGTLLVLEAGTVRAKLGYMPGMGTVGTVAPSGWGIWTQNGYFQGIVAASTISGGTVTGGVVTGGTVAGALVTGGTVSGAQVTGGTISGNVLIGTAGTIGGFTIEASRLWASAGTIQTGSVVNSSNPGVRLEPAGLFGYGTAGLTFALYSDPARTPYFSSGTITNVTYEVTTASVIRTGTVNPRVQIDNSGIFAYGPTGVLKFQVDAATGLLTASDGQFSGTVSASRVTGGTVSGALVTGGTVSGGIVSGGTVSGAVVSGGEVAIGSVSITSTGGMVFSTGGGILSSISWVEPGVSQHGVLTTITDGYYGSGKYGLGLYGDVNDWSAHYGYLFLFGGIHLNNGFRSNVFPLNNNEVYLGNGGQAFKGVYLYDVTTSSIKLLTINNGTILIL